MTKIAQTTSTETVSVAHDQTHLESLPTTSSKIRYLATQYVRADGKVDMGRIAKILDKRFQHVRNVLITPIKKQ